MHWLSESEAPLMALRVSSGRLLIDTHKRHLSHRDADVLPNLPHSFPGNVSRQLWYTRHPFQLFALNHSLISKDII